MCFAPQNLLYFLNISTSKSDPTDVLWHFLLEMRFAPKRRPLFQHFNLQKWSETDVFPNALRATMACHFSTPQVPKLVRGSNILTFFAHKFASRKFASRHNGVQFFIFHLASWLRTRRFREFTFRPSRATKHWMFFSKIFVPFRAPSRPCNSLPSEFLHLWSSPPLNLSLLTFSMPEIPDCAFHLSILSEL